MNFFSSIKKESGCYWVAHSGIELAIPYVPTIALYIGPSYGILIKYLALY